MVRFNRGSLRGLCSMAALSLIVLVIQNSALVIMTSFSRSNISKENNYYPSTVIMNQEVVKLLMCFVIFGLDDVAKVHRRMTSSGSSSASFPSAAEQVAIDADVSSQPETLVVIVEAPHEKELELKANSHTLRPPSFTRLYIQELKKALWRLDTLKLFLPAVLFTVQNLLIFVGLANLDPVSFQVWSQTKLLSAALFSVWMLDRHLEWMQWGALGVLTLGVLASQLANKRSSSQSNANALEMGPEQQLPQQQTSTLAAMEHEANALLGIAACVISGLSSSYAGVYFEKVVKTTSPTLAVRNIQLSLFGIPLAFISLLIIDVMPNWLAQSRCDQPLHWRIDVRAVPPERGWAALTSDGEECPVRPFYFWQRYDVWLTWGLVVVHAIGGLLVAIVVRYADNILKGFATGIAVIVSGVMSAIIWGYHPTWGFVGGALLVTAATVVFHKAERKVNK